MTALGIYLLTTAVFSCLGGALLGIRYMRKTLDEDLKLPAENTVLRQWDYRSWALVNGEKVINGHFAIAAMQDAYGRRVIWFSDGDEAKWGHLRVVSLLKLWREGGTLPPVDLEDHVGPRDPTEKAA
jgi:hypothetical protein